MNSVTNTLVVGREQEGKELLHFFENLPRRQLNSLLALLGQPLSRWLVSHLQRRANDWVSWDPHPWGHPWLTSENLRKAKAYSTRVVEEASLAARGTDPCSLRFGFVGNMANGMYGRAVPLRRAGLDVSIIIHPHDWSVMSHPSWEEFDGELTDTVTDIRSLRDTGCPLPAVSSVYQDDPLAKWRYGNVKMLRHFPFISLLDYSRWPEYFAYAPTLARLQSFEALLTAQTPYLAYLSGRPYLATQTGGEIWYECSRGDGLGSLQRRAYSAASAVLASNPWTYAHARRYGLNNVVYVPLILDQSVYSPGESSYREQWKAKLGGDFFVFCSSRFDQMYKGSRLGLEGFARFSAQWPGARLVMIDWGNDKASRQRLVDDYGIADKVLVLPLAGKRRLIGYLRAADCLLDQFVLGYFGATALEGMACGVPVIMRLERMQYDALCETGAPPVQEAETPEGVAQRMLELARSPEYHRDAGHAHRQWFIANHGSERWLPVYRDLLAATATGYKFHFDESPLQAALSAEEKIYHEEGLAAAPSYPSYC